MVHVELPCVALHTRERPSTSRVISVRYTVIRMMRPVADVVAGRTLSRYAWASSACGQHVYSL
jgi:hypothetical protein